PRPGRAVFHRSDSTLSSLVGRPVSALTPELSFPRNCRQSSARTLKVNTATLKIKTNTLINSSLTISAFQTTFAAEGLRNLFTLLKHESARTRSHRRAI